MIVELQNAIQNHPLTLKVVIGTANTQVVVAQFHQSGGGITNEFATIEVQQELVAAVRLHEGIRIAFDLNGAVQADVPSRAGIGRRSGNASLLNHGFILQGEPLPNPNRVIEVVVGSSRAHTAIVGCGGTRPGVHHDP